MTDHIHILGRYSSLYYTYSMINVRDHRRGNNQVLKILNHKQQRTQDTEWRHTKQKTQHRKLHICNTDHFVQQGSSKVTSLVKMPVPFEFMVFNATFNNISVISWRSVLLLEDTRMPGETHRPVASYPQTLPPNVVSSTPRHQRGSNSKL